MLADVRSLERLQAIHNPRVSARTFERTGFKVSDPERWRASRTHAGSGRHTSSDEITPRLACAVLYEVAAAPPTEKA
jgi:hypothetical protein